MGYQEDMDADELLMSASRTGAKAAVFPNIGSVVEGFVTQRPRKTEQRDADGKAKTFGDGTVRMQVLIELQTEQRDPDVPDDDGLRTLWCKWEIQKAVSAAIIAAGVKRLEIGGFLQVGRSQDLPPAKKTYKPTQTFVAKYTPPAIAAADDIFSQAAPAVQPQFAEPPLASGGVVSRTVVFENQHQPTQQPKMTTLDQLKAASFNAQGAQQNQEPPF